MSTLDRIIEGCRNGESDKQRELYDKYSPRFYALCCRYAHDDFTAKEILMDGFLTVFNSIGDYRGEGSFEGWMQTIFLRQAFKTYNRDAKMYQNTDRIGDSLESVLSEDLDMRIDIRDAMLKSLRRLNPEQRYLFNIVAIEGYSIEEAAKMLKQHESAVKTQYYRTRGVLQKLMARYLGNNYQGLTKQK